jgi:hydrogenase maturation protease
MTRGVVVIGYGNMLRSDDGVGGCVAERVADDTRFVGVTVLQRHQLTPELSLDVSRADLVALVDASPHLPAGTFAIERVVVSDEGPSRWTHRMEPATLVALARQLYGRAPEVHVVSVGARSLDVGDRLTPLVQAAVPRVVDALADLIARETGTSAHPDDGDA